MSEIDVLCIGDLDVDMFISVPSIPGFDQKVGGRNHGQKPGGMAANAAVAISRFGLRSRLISAVGDDPAGVFAVAEIGREGVDLDFLSRRNGVNTFMCVVLISPSGEKSLIRLETDAYLPSVADLQDAAFSGVRHVHMTYGSSELSLEALKLAASAGLSTSLDLEPPDIARNPLGLGEVLSYVDTLFLNSEALELATRLLGQSFGVRMLREAGEMIVTMGAKGCRRITAEDTVDMPGFAVASVDTTGAGDCFAGSYLASRLSGASPSRCLEFANAAAALATLDYGAQAAMPRRPGVEDFLELRRHEMPSGPRAPHGVLHAGT
ncbi:MAG: carbohydrate kinase family protein [Mesorhizobium sp.]|nr:carbohydrate kinase family protein [Mesorhizobium sp.]MBL8579851.1 carbohydrate kinase family protein [Mesorhizobium sp.]